MGCATLSARTLAFADTPIDPASWGINHAGRPVPAYEDGNTCLFCHRTSIGPSWQKNRHATTIRALNDEPNAAQLNQKADDEFVLGREARLRFLKPTGAYGIFALLDLSWSPVDKQWHGEQKWDAAKFGAKCAGCHASGVDSVAKTFQMPSLDCHTCHGLAVPEHTEDGTLMVLSKKGKTRPEIEISICGSCHLRGGKSKSTGLPYPSNFVPGDNVFKDYEHDFAVARTKRENPGDAHIVQNIRDVAVTGVKVMTCMTCHDVHKQSTAKHTNVAKHAICFVCHTDEEPLKAVRAYERRSATCEY